MLTSVDPNLKYRETESEFLRLLTEFNTRINKN